MTSKKLVKVGNGKQVTKNSQQSTKQLQNDNSELIGTNEEIKGTPFRVIKEAENVYAVTYGEYGVKRFHTKQEAKSAVYRKDWDIILTAGHIHSIYVNEVKASQNENTEE